MVEGHIARSLGIVEATVRIFLDDDRPVLGFFFRHAIPAFIFAASGRLGRKTTSSRRARPAPFLQTQHLAVIEIAGNALFTLAEFIAVYRASHSRHFAGGQLIGVGGCKWKMW
jgi:hypothetical protein